MDDNELIKYTSSKELLESIFNCELSNPEKYDQEIVDRFRQHLGQSSIHSRAGKKLAEDLILLARSRVEEGRE